MSDLAALRTASDASEVAFRKACTDAGFSDEWEAYRAEAHGPWPDALIQAHEVWMNDLHAFYLHRDGPNGVLGGRGL